MSQELKSSRDIEMLTFLQLSKENTELKKQALVKSKKAAAIAHDVSGQISAVSLLLRKLRRDFDTNDNAIHAEILESVNNSLNSIQETATSLLSEEKHFAQQMNAPVALGNLFRDIVLTYKESADQKGLTLRCVDTSIEVELPEAALRRIIENLIRNAINYTHHGGVLLGVKRDKNGHRICVVDTGVGFSAQQKREFLAPFEKGEHSEGNGIGLFSVSELSCELGCKFHIRSRLEKGSSCELLLSQESYSA